MHGAVEDAAITVDFDTKQVSGFYPGVYPITRIDDETIVFSMDFQGPDKLMVAILGNIDRVTGETMVIATKYDRPGQMAFSYYLMCNLARRLF
jgi:hypothetical protein